MPLLPENMSVEQPISHKLGPIVPLTEKDMCDLSEIRNRSSPKSMNLYEKHLPNNESLELESETFADRSDEDFEDTKNESDENSTEENEEENEDNEEIEENDEIELNEDLVEEPGDNEEIEKNGDSEQIEDNEENEENGDIEEMEENERNEGIDESEEHEGNEEIEETDEENEEREENMQLDDLEGAVLMVTDGNQILIQQGIIEDENENSNQEYVYSALRYSTEEDSDDARK